jgi:hypothetical protein
MFPEPRLVPRLIILLCLSALPVPADIFSDMRPGEWKEIPDSKLEAVKPDPVPPGNTGVKAVMDAWSGGAFDTRRDRLIVWGGGHSDYAGNEVYVFDIASLKWARLTDPSADVGGSESSGAYPDGKPRSRHTYNGIAYVASLDRFCAFGGGGLYPSGQVGTERVDCFDFGTKAWERKADALAAGTGEMAVYDAASGQVWLQGTGNADYLTRWDPAADRWTRHARSGLGFLDYYYTGAVGMGKLLALGRGDLLVWDLAKPDSAPEKAPTTGDTAILAADNPGFVFDTANRKFAAWSGGREVYLLDPVARKWQRVPLAPGSLATPTAANGNGTFGRFQYIPSRNAFIAVNRTDENVFLFKADSLPPATALRARARPASPTCGRAARQADGRAAFRAPAPTPAWIRPLPERP